MTRLVKSLAILVMCAGPAVAETEEDSSMRSLTSSFLTNLSGDAPAAPEVQADGTAKLTALIQQAMSEGQSDDYLDALMTEAVAKGEIEVSDGMKTTGGAVDTKVLLASLVSKSSSDAAPAVEREVGGAEEAVEDRFYTVKPGDSLAAISLAYYATAQEYNRIFQANRDSLRSADQIRVGQVLLIPSL